MPRPMSETTDATKTLTSVKCVITRTMPLAPMIVRPPTSSGSAAAMTPPNTKNSSTATAGIARISMRLMSFAMVSLIALATGCMPASWTSTPSIANESRIARKLFVIAVSLSPFNATLTIAWDRSSVASAGSRGVLGSVK
ncbi:hypothetical protein RHDE110596_23910 [Prescottella defluvii]